MDEAFSIQLSQLRHCDLAYDLSTSSENQIPITDYLNLRREEQGSTTVPIHLEVEHQRTSRLPTMIAAPWSRSVRERTGTPLPTLCITFTAWYLAACCRECTVLVSQREGDPYVRTPRQRRRPFSVLGLNPDRRVEAFHTTRALSG